MLPWAAAGVVATFATLAQYIAVHNSGSIHIVPGACERAEGFLKQHVIGQDLAVDTLVDAVCTHLGAQEAAGSSKWGHNPAAAGSAAIPHMNKPLILSVHGPPGVGKTFTHTLLARALYNQHPEHASRCPGVDCQGAKIVMGLDFTSEQRTEQLERVRTAIIQHVQTTPSPLIVIEEYDKLDCPSRAMLRQLIQHPEVMNTTAFGKAIIMFESNLGFQQLEEMLSAAGDRSKITAESVERLLRNEVFSLWQATGCEAYQDTLTLVSLVDFFLPYFPLQRPQVEQLMRVQLQHWGRVLMQTKGTRMEWDEAVVQLLSDKVDFDGPYPLEGAKQVSSVATRYVARLVRQCPQPPPPTEAAKKPHFTPLKFLKRQDGEQGSEAAKQLELPVLRLRVAGVAKAAAVVSGGAGDPGVQRGQQRQVVLTSGDLEAVYSSSGSGSS